MLHHIIEFSKVQVDEARNEMRGDLFCSTYSSRMLKGECTAADKKEVEFWTNWKPRKPRMAKVNMEFNP